MTFPIECDVSSWKGPLSSLTWTGTALRSQARGAQARASLGHRLFRGRAKSSRRLPATWRSHAWEHHSTVSPGSREPPSHLPTAAQIWAPKNRLEPASMPSRNQILNTTLAIQNTSSPLPASASSKKMSFSDPCWHMPTLPVTRQEGNRLWSTLSLPSARGRRQGSLCKHPSTPKGHHMPSLCPLAWGVLRLRGPFCEMAPHHTREGGRTAGKPLKAESDWIQGAPLPSPEKKSHPACPHWSHSHLSPDLQREGQGGWEKLAGAFLWHNGGGTEADSGDVQKGVPPPLCLLQGQSCKSWDSDVTNNPRSPPGAGQSFLCWAENKESKVPGATGFYNNFFN